MQEGLTKIESDRPTRKQMQRKIELGNSETFKEGRFTRPARKSGRKTSPSKHALDAGQGWRRDLLRFVPTTRACREPGPFPSIKKTGTGRKEIPETGVNCIERGLGKGQATRERAQEHRQGRRIPSYIDYAPKKTKQFRKV